MRFFEQIKRLFVTKRRLSCQQFDECAPKGIEVGPGAIVPPCLAKLLWGHVGGGADQYMPLVSGGKFLLGARYPEVTELDLAVFFGNEQVAWFDVAVDDSFGVDICEGMEHRQLDVME